MRHSVVKIACGLIGLLLISCSSQDKLPLDPLVMTAGQELTVRGRVIENDLGCDLNVACFLRVETDGHEAVVLYHYGEWPPCSNEPAIRAGLLVGEGDTIEAFGIVGEEGGYLSTCESAEYYIRIAQ